MSIGLFIYKNLTALLPETSLYGLKARLLGMCGLNVHETARVVSSARFLGAYRLSVGADTFIGHEVLLAGGVCHISIGNNCDIGPRVTIVAGSHEMDMIGLHSAGAGISRDIIIEDGVWIGANVTVLGGVRIGGKSVIGAGSVVTRDIPPYVLAVGNPCRPLKRWNVDSQRWELIGGTGDE